MISVIYIFLIYVIIICTVSTYGANINILKLIALK
jgi:hypothetical protein